VDVSELRAVENVVRQRDEGNGMKLIVGRADGGVIGDDMIGGDAAEIIQGVGSAL